MSSELPTRAEWSIPEGITYLNHGSFGPAARCVQEKREEWTRALQRQPMEFFIDRMDPALDESMQVLAKFVGADARDMVFVDNATVAMNVVAESVKLTAADEVLLTDHEYGAVVRIWRRVCDQAGARLVIARVGSRESVGGTGEASDARTSFRFNDADDVVQPIFDAVTERTKLIVVSHITSPTAVIFPVAEVCRRARELGVPVCIDGPHAIAMLDLNLRAVDCDYYCASLHKWLSAPFGSGFLYVKRSRQKTLQSHMISWGRSLGGFPERWQDQLNWLGTRDPAAFLSVPSAIQFLKRIGLTPFRETTHRLAQKARTKLGILFGETALVPDSADWYGSMVAVPLTKSDFKKPRPNSMHPLQKELRERFRIEVPITECGGQFQMRVSCHLYNTDQDVDYLVESINACKTRFSGMS